MSDLELNLINKLQTTSNHIYETEEFDNYSLDDDERGLMWDAQADDRELFASINARGY